MPHFTTAEIRLTGIENLAQRVTLIVSELPVRELLEAREELRLMATAETVPQAVLQHLALVEGALQARAAHLRHHTWFHLQRSAANLTHSDAFPGENAA